MRRLSCRKVSWTSVIIVIWVLVIFTLAIGRHLHHRSYEKKGVKDDTIFLDSNSDLDSFASYSFDITWDNMRNDSHPVHNSCCFLPHVRPNLINYLAALKNSVRIVSLPPSLSSEISGKCASLGSKKKAIKSHPHSIELQFPMELKLMARSNVKNIKSGAKDGDEIRDGERDRKSVV